MKRNADISGTPRAGEGQSNTILFVVKRYPEACTNLTAIISKYKLQRKQTDAAWKVAGAKTVENLQIPRERLEGAIFFRLIGVRFIRGAVQNQKALHLQLRRLNVHRKWQSSSHADQ